MTWAIASGSLPPGVTMNPTNGALIGSPTAGGQWFNIQIGALDSTGANAVSAPVTLTVNNGLAWSIGIQSPTGRKGTKFVSNQPKVTNASGDVHFRLVKPFLDWTVDPNTGVVSGSIQDVTAVQDWLVAYDTTGASISHWNVRVSAYDGLGWYCSYQTVCPFDGLTGNNSQAGTGPVFNLIGKPTYEKVGTWPDWLSLDPKNGVASGIPPAAGTYTFESRVTDGFDGATSNRVRSLVVKDGQQTGRSFTPYYPGGTTICAVAGQDFDLGTNTLVGFGPGTTYSYRNSWGGDSRLPAWMTFDKTTGRITGRVPDDATADFWMPIVETASDPAVANDSFEWGGGNRYLSSYAGMAISAPPNMANGYAVTGDYGWFDKNNAFVTKGGRDNRNVFVSGGTLPPGMQVTNDSGGALWGTPTVPGSYTFTVTMTATQCDGRIASVSKDFTAVVVAPNNPYVINSQTVYARQGIPFRSPKSTIGNPARRGWPGTSTSGTAPCPTA